MTEDRPTVLFVCVHNAGRSQMAAALLERAAGDRLQVLSAGSTPADEIHPGVIEAMSEIGIDLRSHRPRLLDPDEVAASDVVVTMGCGDACPIFPGTRYLDWELPDPAGLPVQEVRPIRDEIERRVEGLAAELLG
jgi:arsenate reductase (thioredoxin)